MEMWEKFHRVKEENVIRYQPLNTHAEMMGERKGKGKGREGKK